jgi:heme o synthase
MSTTHTTVTTTSTHPGKLSDYMQFIKLRLSMLVVFSAALGFLIANQQSGSETDWTRFWMLILGGFLVTGSSNGFNQFLERDLDKLMTRTQNRPLPQNRMSINEALILATVMGAAGIFIITVFTNPLSGILSALSLILYTALYTPMKRKTPFAVFVGAFPGAIPPMLGWVAAQQGFGFIAKEGWILFLIQFIWQFPHFWAIAWVMDEDYKKAGFIMLPTGGRDKRSAFQTLVYTLFLIPISLSPVLFGMCSWIGGGIILISGIYFAYQSYLLFRDCTIKAAQKLMFGSFFYLPVVQLAIWLG